MKYRLLVIALLALFLTACGASNDKTDAGSGDSSIDQSQASSEKLRQSIENAKAVLPDDAVARLEGEKGEGGNNQNNSNISTASVDTSDFDTSENDNASHNSSEIIDDASPSDENNDEQLLVDCINTIKTTMEKTWGDHCVVDHDGNLIVVYVWNEGVALDLYAVKNGDAETVALYEETKNKLKELANSLYTTPQKLGVNGCHVLLTLANDINKERLFLVYLDGEQVYDWVEDGNEPDLSQFDKYK